MTMRVVCAWCLTEMTPGDEPTSHGICAECATEVFPALEDEPAMTMHKTKCFFSKREDGTLLCVGAENHAHHYAGDYYANEYFDLLDNFNPVGLTLIQLTNQLSDWYYQEAMRNRPVEPRTLDSDLTEDR